MNRKGVIIQHDKCKIIFWKVTEEKKNKIVGMAASFIYPSYSSTVFQIHFYDFPNITLILLSSDKKIKITLKNYTHENLIIISLVYWAFES